MKRARRLAGVAVCLAVAASGCATVGSDAASSPAPSASATTPLLDMTQPGVAQRMIQTLVAAAGDNPVLMVDIRQHEASVSVLAGGQPHTWAYRGGTLGEVASDLAYVDQVTFDPNSFNLSDVGALFRAAAAVSGSDRSQELQIVDLRRIEHSASELKMSVATNPETRTVFFNPDGTLVPTLDFNTESGISTGLADAIGTHGLATTVSVSSASGAYIEYAAADGATIVRRRRAAKFPVLDEPRSGTDKLPAFDPRVVQATVVWRVLQRYVAVGAFGPATDWSLIADERGGTAAPRLRFTIGTARVTTDLQGNEVKD